MIYYNVRLCGEWGAPGQPWELSDHQRRKLSAEVSGLHPCALGCKNQRPGEVVQVEGLD